MRTCASSRHGGSCRWMSLTALGWRLRISLRKQGAKSGLSLGGGLKQNSNGYLVRDDLPLETILARTAAAPPLGLTSPSAHARLGFSKPRGVTGL